MTDDRDKPRHRGDILGRLHKSPALGVPVPRNQFDDNPTTDVNLPEQERDSHRNTRSPEQAIPHIHRRLNELEVDGKNHLKWRTKMAADVGEIKGTLTVLTDSVLPQLTASMTAISQRDHVIVTKTIEVDAARKVGAVQVETAQQVDAIDAKKNRRDTRLQIVKGIVGGASLIEILHRLGVL